jgi:hypothetical protein
LVRGVARRAIGVTRRASTEISAPPSCALAKRVRTINKWLKAGVLEATELRYVETGTPQGGVISPLLANVYLDEVFDTWFDTEVKPRLRGHAFLIWYAGIRSWSDCHFHRRSRDGAACCRCQSGCPGHRRGLPQIRAQFGRTQLVIV